MWVRWMELLLNTDVEDNVNKYNHLHKEGVVFFVVFLIFFRMASRMQTFARSQGQERTHVC